MIQMSKKAFNFEKVLTAIQSGQAITGKDEVLAPLVKQFTEVAFEAEIEHYFDDKMGRNSYLLP